MGYHRKTCPRIAGLNAVEVDVNGLIFWKLVVEKTSTYIEEILSLMTGLSVEKDSSFVSLSCIPPFSDVPLFPASQNIDCAVSQTVIPGYTNCASCASRWGKQQERAGQLG